MFDSEQEGRTLATWGNTFLSLSKFLSHALPPSSRHPLTGPKDQQQQHYLGGSLKIQILGSHPIFTESKPPKFEVRKADDNISFQSECSSPYILKKNFQMTPPPFRHLSLLSSVPLSSPPNYQLTGGCHCYLNVLPLWIPNHAHCAPQS